MSDYYFVIHFQVCSQPAVHLYGATRGQGALAPLLATLSQSPLVETVVILDFKGVEAANASYLKSTALFLFFCGRLFANPAPRFSQVQAEFSHRPLNIFPVFANLEPDVAEEMTEVFQGRGFAFVEILSWSDEKLESARLRGHLEPSMRETISILNGKKDVTATNLGQGLENGGISSTAWSNRLADLHFNRLATRRRQGKHWHYSLIAERIQLWECGT